MFIVVHMQIPPLQGFTSLERLELSYNQIQSLLPLQSLNSPALCELYVANNAVTAIEVRAQLLHSAMANHCLLPLAPRGASRVAGSLNVIGSLVAPGDSEQVQVQHVRVC